MFLAMLELVRLQAVQLRQERMFGEILIRKHVGFEAIMNEHDAVRDDWK
jgi:segregation and condensation protein A